MKKLLIATSLLLAALTTTSAFAATRHSNVSAQESYAATEGAFVVNGPAVVANGQNLGWDPDPAIRSDLVRQGIQGAEGGN
jgi:hypothetical protein